MRMAWKWRLGMATLLVGLGCTPQGGMPPLRVHALGDGEAKPVSERQVSLRVSLPSSYQVQSLSWTKARLTLSNPNPALLAAPHTQEVRQAGGNAVTETKWGVLPGSGYDLKVWLYDAQDRLLVAGLVHEFALNRGANTVSVQMGPAILGSSYPPVASTGDVLTFEGGFGPEATVTFPGVATPVAATLIGVNRMQVTVPAGVGEGPVTVRTGGKDFPARGLTVVHQPPEYTRLNWNYHGFPVERLRYSHTSFGLGDQFYMSGYQDNGAFWKSTREPYMGNVGNPQASTGLTEERGEHAGLLLGNYYYLMGGKRHADLLQSITRLRIQQDGQTLEPPDPTYAHALPSAAAGMTAEVVGRYVYLIGGDSESVLRAPITSSAGDIGAFERMADMPRKAYGHTSEVIGSKLYVLGGGAVGTEPPVLVARIRDDGSLEAFTSVETGLPPLRHHQSVVLGSYLYVMGGENVLTSMGSSDVWRAPILASGELGLFGKIAADSVSRKRFSLAVVGRHLYVTFGLNFDGTLETVNYSGEVARPLNPL